MKLCMASMSLSAASTNARRADEETPWASGVLRGSDEEARSAAMQDEPATTRKKARR